MKLLIIEDEKDISDSIIAYMKLEGFICESSYNYDDALLKLSLYQYDCIVVDIMLPDGTGLDVVKHLKDSHSTTGIIIISAKNALNDKLNGLGEGADDYLTKPFHLPELSARIKSIIRRRNFAGEQQILLDELKILLDSHQLYVNDTEIDLTKKEFDLLIYLVSNKNRVLTRESIAENLMGEQVDHLDSFNFIYTHVKNLRKKIIAAGGNDYIKTVYSIGYKFSAK